MGSKGGDEVDIGNAFKVLVDTAQKIMQFFEEQEIRIYGKHNIQDRKNMWNDIKGTMNGVNWPIVLTGYFNGIMSIEDRIQGNPVQEVEVRDFKKFVGDAGLTEIRTIGRHYTWTNNNVHNRIDRILVNAEWIQKWPQMEGIIMQPKFSDHCPLKITMSENIVQDKRPFKFFNCLANHQKFEEIVSHYGRRKHSGNKMQNVWYKLKAMKGELKKLNTQEYCSVGNKIQETKNKLMKLQQDMKSLEDDSAVIDEEKKTKMELAKWMEVEESIMKQKARVKWLKEGDSNNTYFHACVKNRHARNHIGRLTNNEGHILQNTKEVGEEILQFYKTVLGTAASALRVVNPDVIKSGIMMYRNQQMLLLKPVTKEEVQTALKGIDDSKTPGCDGYNAYFSRGHGA
ncbi:PREDICTED: uncharacterized protein LOC109205329 [Nicotiana attenuata]|uniref:uncharacterized protein LOC109205329 n=1 Tax=Nicotiana attenuata TaxID=49451 RepID=UPI000905791A|nr:PREDICTED: uncharacterized protein LOC109205329 [Nicotiana attenuata]